MVDGSVPMRKGEPMNDLISRRAAIEAIKHAELGMEYEAVAALPTIEERKTGRWIHVRDEEDGNALYECSVCHMGEVHVPIVEVSYCWNCGADMRGDSNVDK